MQTDFRGAIAVLNKLLNHAARERARQGAAIYERWNLPSDEEIDNASPQLSITGEPRSYVGDRNVWLWYRGTGAGPYPCMSALQACELLCERLIEAQAPIDRIITMLLDGCENLAMVGLIVGLLIRHVEQATPTIDSYLVEPIIWELEFSRHPQRVKRPRRQPGRSRPPRASNLVAPRGSSPARPERRRGPRCKAAHPRRAARRQR